MLPALLRIICQDISMSTMFECQNLLLFVGERAHNDYSTGRNGTSTLYTPTLHDAAKADVVIGHRIVGGTKKTHIQEYAVHIFREHNFC